MDLIGKDHLIKRRGECVSDALTVFDDVVVIVSHMKSHIERVIRHGAYAAVASSDEGIDAKYRKFIEHQNVECCSVLK